MDKLTVILNGYASKDTMFLIDGQKAKFKNNKFGNKEFEYQTEKSDATIIIKRFLEINSKFWLLWQLLFFVISVFGIFDMHGSKGYFVVDCEFKISLNEDTKVTLKMNDSPQKTTACQIECNTSYEEIKNQYFIDEQAKKRGKKLIFAKIITTLLIIAIFISIFLVRS